MMNKKPTLQTLLENAQGKKLLFLGKEGIFTQKEIMRFLKPYQITMTDILEEGVAGVIEHHRLNPVEEDISNDAYEQKLPIYKLSALEQLLSETIDDDALLMAVKLGNDTSRLVRLLGNEHLSDTLFVRLLKLYRFSDEEEDNRQDRDVIMYTLRRYIDINPNEEDLLYSYLTLRRLATEAEDAALLDALMGFPNFTFLVRGKEKITLKETIARNEHIDETLARKLLALRDTKVDISLAGNTSLAPELLKHLYDKKQPDILMSLTTNHSIDDALFDALLEEEEGVVSLLLVHQPIDEARFERIMQKERLVPMITLLGANENLSRKVIETLMQRQEPSMLAALSANPALTSEDLEEIYQHDIEESFIALAQNPRTPQWILQALYDESTDNTAMLAALAHNPSLPETLLHQLFEKNELEINRGLATNASLPMELLDILKVDTRLQNELAQNDNLASSFEQVLKQNKVMMNV